MLLGPPASGKGTLAEYLSGELAVPHFSSGQIIRNEVPRRTLLGKQAETYLKKGKLIPDGLALKLMRPYVEQEQYILDGFPRTLPQGKALEKIRFDLILLIDVPQKVVIERVTGRRTCANGEHVYHLKNNPPQSPGVCDVDGSKLLRREGDTAVMTRKRLQEYRRLTLPLVNYYQKQGLLRVVNGNQHFMKVFQDAHKFL